METWRLITTWGAPPELNMGLDGALLEDADAPPTMRFYSWSPPALSLGYFQRFAEVPAASEAPVVVRRITGGGAIHHANELTFSIATSLGNPLFQGPVTRSYARIHELVCAALSKLGCEAALRGDGTLLSDAKATGMCFHHSTALDIAWAGRKGVGSAQRRRKGRVLHHGSIKLGTTTLEGDIATVRERAPKVEVQEMADALETALSETVGMSFEAGVPTPAERVRAHELGTRFLDPAFLRRR